jgi:UDP-N-acetylmuramate--alanine ligase
LYPGREVTAIFRPHLYSRTRELAQEFSQSLDLADRVFLLEIYPAREAPIKGVSSSLIFDHMKLEQKVLCSTSSLLDHLAKHDKSQVIVTIGAGGISDLIAPIKQWLLTS